MEALKYLKKLEWDIIDGIDSGVHSEDEATEVRFAIEDIEDMKDKLFELYNKDKDFIRLIKLQPAAGVAPRYCIDKNDNVHKDVFDYKFIHKKDKDLLLKALKDKKVAFEWFNKRAGGYWQRGREFIESYDERLKYRIKNF